MGSLKESATPDYAEYWADSPLDMSVFMADLTREVPDASRRMLRTNVVLVFPFTELEILVESGWWKHVQRSWIIRKI